MMRAKPNEPQVVAAGTAAVKVFAGGAGAGRYRVAAAHPTEVFSQANVELLANVVSAPVACINAHDAVGAEPLLESMVDRIETARRRLGYERWIFWGMSGGGWLAQIYARKYPEALAGVVIESACACFRERVADSACALSPQFPAWRDALTRARLAGDVGASDPSAADDAEWLDLPGAGQVLRRPGGAALLVSPAPLAPEMKRAMPAFWRFDSRAWLPSLAVRTLVLCGSADPIVPVHRARQIHDTIVGSMFAILDGAGHVPSAAGHPEVLRAFERFAVTLD